MFNLQGSELIIILLLALVVLGPEKLPDAMRKAGQFYAELKKMSSGFQSEFKAVIDEPLKELKDTANTIRDSADFTNLQTGERGEKPKSAEMSVAADAEANPTTELPFGEAAAAGAAVASAAGTDGLEDGALADGGNAGGPDLDGGQADDGQSTAAAPPIPAPPMPFSSSQTLSAAGPTPPGDDQAEGAETSDSDADADADAAPPMPFSSSQTLSTSPRTSAEPPPGSDGESAAEELEPADGARSDEPSEEHTE